MTRIRYYVEDHQLLRMIGWLPAALFLYLVAISLSPYVGESSPQLTNLQVLAWKYGHACGFSWIGYWIARQVTGRLQDIQEVDTNYEAIVYAARILARAILVAGAMGFARGL